MLRKVLLVDFNQALIKDALESNFTNYYHFMMQALKL